ncbi:VOC family protein [Streptomyces sp. TRM43335]|uniref:VOC family protein n=1 Tax=Streptomyces taklimakanensis TaxID=2569853 RepID=A0A6G2BAM2_9ACTN|nr:VOC family protein [Streptomyces taklimakanensis]MTE19321.1 VOC family protein [Streptomyces taklimakanensis]
MPINTLRSVVVLDCPAPGRLADFYARMLGGRVEGEGRWVEVTFDSGALAGRRLAFQEAEGHVPPQWPSAERSQQFHLDFYVPREELDAAEREVLGLGAELVEGDDDGKRGFRVYLDPAGHPFCLCVD